MKICLIDFETTSKDPETAIPLEIGAIIIEEVSPGLWVETAELNYFIKDKTFIEVPKNITELTGITTEKVVEAGRPAKDVIQWLLKFSEDCTWFMAHNKAYDLTILSHLLIKNFERGEIMNHRIFQTENWICSLDEMPYDEKYRCKILSHLALDHGAEVNQKEAHSALYDVRLIQKILSAGAYSLQDILSYRSMPWIYLQALVEYEQRQQAKDAGYSWEQVRGDDKKFPKKWIKRIKENKFDAEKAVEVPFKRVRV